MKGLTCTPDPSIRRSVPAQSQVTEGRTRRPRGTTSDGVDGDPEPDRSDVRSRRRGGGVCPPLDGESPGGTFPSYLV